MPQTIRIKRGTKAQLDAYGPLQQGEMGFCTDTKEVYIGDGTTNTFVGRAMSGPLANRPNASAAGRFYFATDDGYLYLDLGTAWQRISVKNLTDLNGTVDDIADGTNYAKVKKTDVTNGSVNKVSDGTKTATAAQIRDHIDNAAIHRQINDAGTGPTDLWSAQKIRNEIELAKRNIEPQASVKNRITTTPPTTPQSVIDTSSHPAQPAHGRVKPAKLQNGMGRHGICTHHKLDGRAMSMMSKRFIAGTGRLGCARAERCRRSQPETV